MHETIVRRAPLSVRLTDDGHHLLDDLAASLGVSKSAVIEMAIREKARREYDEDSWAYTAETRASIARARAQPGYPVTPTEMEEIAVAAETGDASTVIERIIAKYRDG
ncbi:MAG: ribbon-helix-helix protein, CopG family [Chloroflexota bacterium]|nr:ribbon-helix-helix protein, CopG family [Chloroflexota bacterium]